MAFLEKGCPVAPPSCQSLNSGTSLGPKPARIPGHGELLQALQANEEGGAGMTADEERGRLDDNVLQGHLDKHHSHV